MPVSKKIVRQGYNRISRKYRDDQGRGPDAKKMLPWLKAVKKRLPGHGRILELGCGIGVPAARFFAGKHDYLGVDLSDVQIRRAKKLVPQGRFLREDMSRLKFKPLSFDAVLGFYSIIHLPLGEQLPLFPRIFRWLKPGGVFMSVLGHGRWTGKEKDWHGAEMFWSHADQNTYRLWLTRAGFRIYSRWHVREGKGGHDLFLCVKPRA